MRRVAYSSVLYLIWIIGIAGFSLASDPIGRASVSDTDSWESLTSEQARVSATDSDLEWLFRDAPSLTSPVSTEWLPAQDDPSGIADSEDFDWIEQSPARQSLLQHADCCPGSVCSQRPVCNRVYILRGAVGWWPTIHTFLARLRRHGYEPDVYWFGGINCAVDNLIERRRKGEEAGPVRIIGYSLGGHGACNMARQLKERGVVVDRLLLVECFSNAAITSNVRYCFNLYESRLQDEWNIFRGTPVTRESCATCLVNIDVAVHPDWRKQKSRNHFTMADDTRVQQTLIHLLSCDCAWRNQIGGSCDCAISP